MIKSHHIKREFLTYFCQLVVSKQTFKIWVLGPKNSWNWRKIVFNSLLKGRLVVSYYSCAIPFIWTHFHKFQLQKGIKQCGKRMTFKRWQKKISKTSKSKQARQRKILHFQKHALKDYGVLFFMWNLDPQPNTSFCINLYYIETHIWYKQSHSNACINICD